MNGAVLAFLVGAACAPVSRSAPGHRDVAAPISITRDETVTQTLPEAESGPGNLVVRLQQDLSELGYYGGEETGTFDSATQDAMKRFEHDVGLHADGFYDPQTASVIDLALGRLSSVATLQSALSMLGYYAGPVDGLVRDSTEDAIARVEQSAGLQQTGRFGPEIGRALLGLIKDERPQRGWIVQPDIPEPPLPVEPVPELEAIALAEVQRRLIELGYRPGPVDGEEGSETRGAILTFQKREGLDRDGILGPQTLARLESPQGAGPRTGLPIPRIEIDLARQIAFVLLADGSVTTMSVSTGNGERYVTDTGATAIAHTPVGSFVLRRRIDGVREAPLGTLYRPLYFRGGWAIHGSRHVPAYPASHGCVRTHLWDQDWLFDEVGVGVPVVVYDDRPGANEVIPADAGPGS